MTATKVVLTLDVGTSSLRTMLYDQHGNSLPGCETQIEHHVNVTSDGGAELDPQTLFENSACAIDGALARLPADHVIVGVATDTLWHSVLGVDRAGRAITPLYTWADTRAAGAADMLRSRLDPDAVHARTGCFLHPSYLPARLLWLSQTQPDVWKNVGAWLSFGEYLHRQLFGSSVCSISMASGTGLLDVHRCEWDEDVLNAVGLDTSRLSPLGDVASAMHELRSAWANRWPLLAHVPWFPALGDGACSNVGSGCTAPSQIALMVGTSGATRVVLEGPDAHVKPGLWMYRIDRHRPIAGGALSEGGNLVAWARATLRVDDLPAMESELAGMMPDGHGLTVLPFLAGERSPGWAAEARGVFAGVTLSTRPLDFVRAALEAIAYRFALIHKLLDSLAAPDAVVVASGGALLSSPTWMTIMADVLNRPVVASAEREASSRGAALLALESLGLVGDVAAIPSAIGARFIPDSEQHARYEQALARQVHLYQALITDNGLLEIPTHKGQFHA